MHITLKPVRKASLPMNLISPLPKASEWRALAHLPGVEHARIWEPEPEVIYAWSREGVSV